VVQIDGNPIGEDEDGPEKGLKSIEVGSDSGVASQEEEMSEKNDSNIKEIEKVSENVFANLSEKVGDETSTLNNNELMENVRF